MLIVKIIGIVLLAILGILLTAVLLLLLVPFRYRLEGSWHGKPAGSVRVTWLLHAVSVLVGYEEGLDITAKLLGFRVFHLAPGEDAQPEEGGERSGDEDDWVGGNEADRQADRAGANEDDRTGGEEDGLAGENEGGLTGDASGPAPDGKTETVTGAAEAGTDGTAGAAEDALGCEEPVGAMSIETQDDGTVTEGIDLAELPTLEEQLRQDEEDADGADLDSGDGGIADSEASKDGSGAEPPADGMEDGSGAGLPADGMEDGSGAGLPADGMEDGSGAEPPADETENGSQRDAEDSGDIIDKMEDAFDRIGEKLEWADQKRRWIVHFLEDPKNQKTIRLVWRQLKAIIRHILPQKAKGQITFGFDNPATTGQILAACSMLYALYGTELTITPDFENAVIDGDLQLKGRICIGALAARAVRVLIDRNLWRMIKKVRKFLKSGGK